LIGLFEESVEDPRARKRRIVIFIIALIGVGYLSFYLIYFTWLHMPQRIVTQRFFNVLVSGDMQHAYEVWKADPQRYSFKDFQDDWGPNGYYGPVKSYRIESANSPPRSGSGIILIVEVSPYSPFPADDDISKSRATKEVRLWVENRDKSLGFAP
jgi:hypothetical protein